MAVSEETREALYARAGGRCECEMRTCEDHRGSRCARSLIAGIWKAHPRVAGRPDTLNNLVAMCIPCYENTRSSGKSFTETDTFITLCLMEKRPHKNYNNQ